MAFWGKWGMVSMGCAEHDLEVVWSCSSLFSLCTPLIPPTLPPTALSWTQPPGSRDAGDASRGGPHSGICCWGRQSCFCYPRVETLEQENLAGCGSVKIHFFKKWLFLDLLTFWRQSNSRSQDCKDFPGGPAVKTSLSNARVSVQSLLRGLRSHSPHDQKDKNLKQKQYCNKLNKYFKKMVYMKKKILCNNVKKKVPGLNPYKIITPGKSYLQ